MELTIIVFIIVFIWVVSAIIYYFLKHKSKQIYPVGSYVASNPIENKEIRTISSISTKIFATLIIATSSFQFFIFLIIVILDLEYQIPAVLRLNLPIWLNIIGILGICGCYAWGILIMKFNVNYTPIYKSIKGKYILATEGPYKYTRHPMYFEKIVVLIFTFLATGIWIGLASLLGIPVIIKQMKGEEQLLLQIFGETYNKYMKITNRFFPNLKNYTPFNPK